MTGNAANQRDRGAFPVGTVFGGYVVTGLLGAGGMGEVYEARHPRLDRRAAIKTVLPSYVGDAEVAARFVREGRAAARISHPHIVSVFDAGTHESGVPYLVMELLEGEDLEHRLEREQRLDPSSMADVLLPVLSAVAAAHERGVVHRDLKPSNIFLARDATGSIQPKVLDFGISKVFEDVPAPKLTNTNSILGTAYYMAPEQLLASNSVDARCDQYALGVIFYECLSGRLPHLGSNFAAIATSVLHSDPPPLDSLVPQLPSSLVELVHRAMSKAPDARFPSVRALGATLLPFASARMRAVFHSEFESAAGECPATRDTMPHSAPRSPVEGDLGASQLRRKTETVAVPLRAFPSWWKLVALGVVLIAGFASAVWMMSSRTPSNVATRRPSSPPRTTVVGAPHLPAASSSSEPAGTAARRPSGDRAVPPQPTAVSQEGTDGVEPPRVSAPPARTRHARPRETVPQAPAAAPASTREASSFRVD